MTVLPEMLECNEFVNADMIAYGLSPLNPQGAAIAAGRIMLERIKALVADKKDFAFETTLSTRSYVNLVRDARNAGFTVTLLFFWLRSADEAKMRVAERVSTGGHFIPDDVVERRYRGGLRNFFRLYKENVDAWLLFDNSDSVPELVAKGDKEFDDTIINPDLWTSISEYGS